MSSIKKQLIIFGSQWVESVPVFQILSLSVGIQIAQSPIGAIFQSLNKVRGLFYSSIIILFVITIAIGLGIYQKNLNYIAIYMVISFYIAYVIYNYYLSRMTKMSLFPILSLLARPILLGIGLWILLFIFSYFINIENNILSLIIKSFLSLMYFLILIFIGELQDFPIPNKLRIWK